MNIDLADNPEEVFAAWFDEARAQEPFDPEAFVLATASKEAVPSLRTLLLKDVMPVNGEMVYVFYSNTCSQKVKELAENPQASMLFYWRKLYRQVRLSGQVVTLPREVAETYFQTRPLLSQLSAIASYQSEVIASRSVLTDRIAELTARYQDDKPTCPDYWQAYALVPTEYEFWIGDRRRLHHRLRFQRRDSGQWQPQILSP